MTQLQTLQDIYSKINDIYEKFCDFDTRLTNVETKVTNIETKVTNTYNKLVSVETKLTDIYDKLISIESDVINTYNKLVSFEKKITDIYDKLITIESDVSTIKGYVSINITGEFEFTSCKDEPAPTVPYPAIVDALISALISNLTNLIINAAFGRFKANPLINLVISKVSELVSNALADFISQLIRQTLKPAPKIITLTYTGQGLNGIANQVSMLAKHLDKMTQLLCPDLTIPISSLECVKDNTGSFSLVPTSKVITGRGFNILAPLGSELSRQQGKIVESVCNISSSGSDAVPIFIGEKFEMLPVSSQLVLKFQHKDAKTREEKKSAWYVSIPDPIPCEKIFWCVHFEPMQRVIGNVFATVKFGSHKNKTSCYFQSEEEAIAFMTKWIIPLSQTKPVMGNDDLPVRIVKNGSPLRKPRNRVLKVVSATWIDIDKDTGEPKNVWTFKPPRNGC
ncbi:hypothetical protein V2H45_05960 [Tumidithrix elongata RA019]|uniref:Uncharacterized protein n=1 Tax=Tumidithrix elongata BACA0141 TaxID=2716417 RepID=A0AAW9Q0Z2_9CYAN|nr:hypothetical protein [Tumidithrix elongata RA019]